MALFGGAPSVGRFTPGNSSCLHFYSRSLIGPHTPSEKELWYLHQKYGASFRDLIVYAKNPEGYDDTVNAKIRGLPRQGLIRLYTSADNSHFLVSTGPSPSDRTKPERKIASSHILEECCRIVLWNRAEEIRKFFDTLKTEPTMSAAAGMVFEYRAHRFLQEGRVIDLFPILGRITTQGEDVVYDDYTATDDETDRVQVLLPKLKGFVFTDQTGAALEVNTYYRPRAANPPAIDSWVLSQPTPEKPPTLLTFQVALDVGKYDAKRSGLDKVNELRVPGGTRRCLVVFTPTGVKPRISVSRDYLTDKFLDGRHPNVVFPVFHYQISSDVLFRPPL
jgi:hypothetical protein